MDTDCPTLLARLDCDGDGHVTIDELNDKFIAARASGDWSFLNDEEFDIDAFMDYHDENNNEMLDYGEFETCYYAFCNEVCPDTNPDDDADVTPDDILVIGLAQV